MRHPNYRLVKIHRSYTVNEVAACLRVHRNTVREWIRSGLPTCDNRRPTLVLGRELASFLLARRTQSRRPCGPGELYCVRCRLPRRPAGEMADYLPRTATSGDLMGLCAQCETPMYRRVRSASLPRVAAGLDLRFAEGSDHIVESRDPSANSAFEDKGRR